ncbi:TetR/AcrR family transcriptional regulator [Hathewaya massiliensis]|uniref:TetR/AcrR family transcriptional regulator n=1 Tax=Hathewaya massiliensis TaxID=1964382 RepID=UPI00115B6F22|nr:TetR/AcrR family transcriptional regulator [Hathewaya massiliensis]
MDNKDNNIGNQYKILEATKRLIVKKGIESTSLSDIAREVGISKGTLYYYFSSKNDLINEIARQYFYEIEENINNTVEKLDRKAEPVEVIKKMFKEILKSEEKGRLHLCLVQESMTNNEDLRKKINEEYIKWKTIIKEGLRLIFKNKDLDYEVISNIIVAALQGFMIQNIMSIDYVDIDSVVKYVLKEK